MPNPFAHVELSTDDVKKAKKFYAAVFAWKMSDVPGMNYTMIDVAGGAGGGLQKKPTAEQPTAWLPYVQVDDVKATLAKVAKAGGTLLLDYHDIGDMGAIGVFADPQGAALGVWAAAKPAPPAASPKKASSRKVALEAAASPAAKKSSKKAAPAPEPTPVKKAPAKKAAPPARASSKRAPAKKR